MSGMKFTLWFFNPDRLLFDEAVHYQTKVPTQSLNKMQLLLHR